MHQLRRLELPNAGVVSLELLQELRRYQRRRAVVAHEPAVDAALPGLGEAAERATLLGIPGVCERACE